MKRADVMLAKAVAVAKDKIAKEIFAENLATTAVQYLSTIPIEDIGEREITYCVDDSGNCNPEYDIPMLREYDITQDVPQLAIISNDIGIDTVILIENDGDINVSSVEGDETTDQFFQQDDASEDDRRYDPDFIPLTQNDDDESSDDNECSVAENEEGNDSTAVLKENNGRTRRKRRHVDSSTWFCNSQFSNREQGKEYFGRKQHDYKVEKQQRTLKHRCSCSIKKKYVYCASITEADREKIFQKFWTLSWGEKKIYTSLLMTKSLPKRFRGRNDPDKSRRTCSFEYHLESNGKKVRVCKKMFLTTLSISEWSASNWKKQYMKENVADISEENDDLSPQLKKRKEVFKNRKEALTTFLNSLAKVESHYCRARTQKRYLEPNWTGKAELYRCYVNWCHEEGRKIEPLSSGTFDNEFDDQNLALFSPKKDLCDTCYGHECGTVSDEKYQIHIASKEAARAEKEKDDANEEFVYSMDLESVLLSPRSNVSAMYYHTKLIVHNFTIYGMKKHDGECFLWHEAEGHITANEFSTVIWHFIESVIQKHGNAVKKIIFYSDVCCYQNRNTTLSNCLLNVSNYYKIVIEQKFLTKGHTQMEVDSMHASIERILKHATVHVPADYIRICQIARPVSKFGPYNVTYLTHDFFQSFVNLEKYKSICPGYQSGDPTVTDIVALQYADNLISYKLNFSDTWSSVEQRHIKRGIQVENCSLQDCKQLYESTLPIKKSKWQHLQELKSVIPPDFHSFYDLLKFN